MVGSASVWRLTLFAAITLLALPGVVSAAGEYGSDVYGGGTYNVGVVPAPAPTPAPSGGGGGVIGGPLSVGYVNSPPVVTTATTATMVPTGTPPVSQTSPLTGTSAPSQFIFAKSLQFRDRDPDVKKLQVYLNVHGFQITTSGGGSPGHETDYFGALTMAALVRFQNAHADEILKPAGLTSGTGYFGPATRAFITR